MYIIKLIELVNMIDIYMDREKEAKRIRTEILVPALKEHAKVNLDLGGYNRWTRSFLNEAIAGLIREDGYTRNELKERLVIHPSKHTESIGLLVNNLIGIAEMQRLVKRNNTQTSI